MNTNIITCIRARFLVMEAVDESNRKATCYLNPERSIDSMLTGDLEEAKSRYLTDERSKRDYERELASYVEYISRPYEAGIDCAALYRDKNPK